MWAWRMGCQGFCFLLLLWLVPSVSAKMGWGVPFELSPSEEGLSSPVLSPLPQDPAPLPLSCSPQASVTPHPLQTQAGTVLDGTASR